LQGFGGSFSHQDENRYAIDFSEPEGTPVCAIRDGEVIQLKQDSHEGGSDSSYLFKANFILIRHEDGTIAEYYHLKQNGVLVKVGQKVRAGEVIGYSGRTGFTTEPHLHVAVYFMDAQGKKNTVPIVFDTAQDPALRLESGEAYSRPFKTGIN
jgi:murein DD-endopeptidase MepM/ murein hydrolase activator NlpD